MPNKSLPLELLIKIVNIVLGDREKYPFGGIGEIPDWRTPLVSRALNRILDREKEPHTSTKVTDASADIANNKIGDAPTDSVVEDAEEASQTTTHSYTVTRTLRLYAIIFF
jgi:hypothetical protein